MVQLIIQWFVLAACLYLTAMLVPGFHIRSFGSSLLAVSVIGLLNMFVTPILYFLTLPINILTLGLFTFLLNAIVLRIAAGLLKGFDIDNWISATIGSVILALMQSLIHWLDGGRFALSSII